MDMPGDPGALGALSGSPNCRGYPIALAKAPGALDSPTGAPESPAHFRADWLASAEAQTARKTARLAQREAQNPQTPLSGGQEGPLSGKIRRKNCLNKIQ